VCHVELSVMVVYCRNSSQVIVSTPPVSDAVALPIIVQFQLLFEYTFSHYNATTSDQFYFGLNPTVLEIYPLEHITS